MARRECRTWLPFDSPGGYAAGQAVTGHQACLTGACPAPRRHSECNGCAGQVLALQPDRTLIVITGVLSNAAIQHANLHLDCRCCAGSLCASSFLVSVPPTRPWWFASYLSARGEDRRNPSSRMQGAHRLMGRHPMVGMRHPCRVSDLHRYGSWEAWRLSLALRFICEVERRLHLHPLTCWAGQRMT
jgi:hypothetical protein